MNNNNEIRAKYRKKGFKGLSQAEKIRLVLSYSEKSDEADALAAKLSEYYGSLRTMSDADPVMLKSEYGLSQSSAVLLGIIPALTRICAINGCRDVRLNTTENARKFFAAFFNGCRTEVIAAAAVNKSSRITGSIILTYGSDYDATVSYRRAVDFAYEQKAASVFIAHCHPDGNCKPSENDISATMQLIEALDMLNIPLADHIITSGEISVSLREYLGVEVFTTPSADDLDYSLVTTDVS